MLIIKKLLLQINVKINDLLFLIMLKAMKLPLAVRERIKKSKMEDRIRRLHTNIKPKIKMHH